jgi:hypothetical protein
MECSEPRHNRHTVSLLTDCTVVLPKVSQTRKRYVLAPCLRAGFGDWHDQLNMMQVGRGLRDDNHSSKRNWVCGSD